MALESLRTQIGIPHKFLESVGFSVGMHAAFMHISICNKPLVEHETPLKISGMSLSDPVCQSGKQENGVPYFPQMPKRNKAACNTSYGVTSWTS